MKKTIALVFVVLFFIAEAFVFISCQKKDTKAASETPTEIYFWHIFSDPLRRDWIQARADEWNETQDTYVLIPEAKGSYNETLNAAILASRQGDPPHLVLIYEIGSQLAKDSGIFKSIQDIGDVDYSDYIDSVLNYYTIDGKVNSIPFNSSAPVLYYNKDLMKQAGLDPDTPPRTFEDIIKDVEIAASKGIEGAAFGVAAVGWFYEQWVAEQGGLLVNNDNGRKGRATEVLLNSPQMKRAFSFIKELNDKGLYKYSGRLSDWDGSNTLFSEAKVMFHITTTSSLGNVLEATKGKFEVGTGYYPVPGDVERNGTVIGGGSVWLQKDHSDEELRAARDFILYMTNTENMVSWHKLTGYFPVRKSSIELLEEEGWFEEDKIRTVAFDQLLDTKVNSATAGALLGTFVDTRLIIEEAIQKVINGADIDETLKTATEQANAKLEDYNKNF